MNFKMSAEFKREFRMAAADRGIRLNELLAEAFEAWKAARHKWRRLMQRLSIAAVLATLATPATGQGALCQTQPRTPGTINPAVTQDTIDRLR
jgi:hypothetical protein